MCTYITVYLFFFCSTSRGPAFLPRRRWSDIERYMGKPVNDNTANRLAHYHLTPTCHEPASCVLCHITALDMYLASRYLLYDRSTSVTSQCDTVVSIDTRTGIA